jgi:hypothetical protein
MLKQISIERISKIRQRLFIIANCIYILGIVFYILGSAIN